jgi:hypothetical protein
VNTVSAAQSAAFWAWFVNNEERLYAFEADQDTVFEELLNRLALVHRDLTFEFGPVREGVREFAISAGGIKEAFPAVRTLAAASPQLPRWRILPFRQRRPPDDIVSIQGLTVALAGVRFELRPEGGKAGIVLFMPGYTKEDNSRYVTLAFLLLDAALGEHDVEMKVGRVDVHALPPGPGANTHPFERLPSAFDTLIASLSN